MEHRLAVRRGHLPPRGLVPIRASRPRGALGGAMGRAGWQLSQSRVSSPRMCLRMSVGLLVGSTPVIVGFEGRTGSPHRTASLSSTGDEVELRRSSY